MNREKYPMSFRCKGESCIFSSEWIFVNFLSTFEYWTWQLILALQVKITCSLLKMWTCLCQAYFGLTSLPWYLFAPSLASIHASLIAIRMTIKSVELPIFYREWRSVSSGSIETKLHFWNAECVSQKRCMISWNWTYLAGPFCLKKHFLRIW